MKKSLQPGILGLSCVFCGVPELMLEAFIYCLFQYRGGPGIVSFYPVFA